MDLLLDGVHDLPLVMLLLNMNLMNLMLGQRLTDDVQCEPRPFRSLITGSNNGNQLTSRKLDKDRESERTKKRQNRKSRLIIETDGAEWHKRAINR
ncbi:uncharacterized protein V6R79_024709 [Siganus canaliculatus]